MARPKKFTDTLPIRILPEQHEDLKLIAGQTQSNVGQVVRQAIAQFLVGLEGDILTNTQEAPRSQSDVEQLSLSIPIAPRFKVGDRVRIGSGEGQGETGVIRKWDTHWQQYAVDTNMRTQYYSPNQLDLVRE